jgi:hypothetical protein
VNSLLENESENPFGRPAPVAVSASLVQGSADRYPALPRAPRSPVRSGEAARRCVAVYLGGPSLEPGKTELTDTPHFCSNLSCVCCDHIILRFVDTRWKPTVNYMFLRLNYPNRLNEGLYPAPGFCAFCCQCTFMDEDRLQKLSAFSSNWVCRGHL